MTRLGALGARLRLVHPFPSFLNGVAVLVMASIAGGSVPTVIRLSVAMVLIQFAIGSLNDVADAPRDTDRVPVKPIAVGLIRASTAQGVAVVAGLGGLILAALSGPITLVVAAVGLGCGVVYDLALSRTSFSWLPLTVALPLVPVFAWSGAVDRIPSDGLAIIPIAMLGGAGLALGNALVDLGADAARGRRTAAVAVGRTRGWTIHAVAVLGAAGAAVALRPPGGGVGAGVLFVLGIGTALAGVLGLRTSAGTAWRLAWGLEAAGVSLTGLAWVLAAAGRPG